jgi:hypothetical protein
MVSGPGGLNFESRPHLPLHVIIPVYRSPYGGARVAQSSGLSDEALAVTQ